MDTSWKKNDTNSPEYKKKVVFYTVLTIVLGVIGGALLAAKIDTAEKARAETPAIKVESVD